MKRLRLLSKSFLTNIFERPVVIKMSEAQKSLLLAVCFLMGATAAGAGGTQNIRDTGPSLSEEIELLRRQTDDLTRNRVDGKMSPVEEQGQFFRLYAVHLVDLPSQLDWMRSKASEVFGNRISTAGLIAGVERMNDLVRREGYISSGFEVPDQNLAAGVLTLNYRPGLVGKVFAEGMDTSRYFAMTPGLELNLRDLEQGLDQYNALPSRRARLFLSEGDGGRTNVTVQALQSQKRWRGNLTWRNGGGGSRGRTSVKGSLTFDDPAGLGDQLRLTARTDTRLGRGDGYSRGITVSWQIPYRAHLFALEAGYEQGGHTLTTSTFKFDLMDKSYWVELSDRVLIHRNGWSKVWFELSAMFWRERSYLGSTELIYQRRKQTFLSAGFSGAVLGRRGSYNWRLAVKRSTPWLAEVLKADDGSTVYTVFEGSFTGLWPLDTSGRWWLSADARGQWTKDQLFSGDQFSVGYGSVRGFGPAFSLRGERGLVVQSELSCVLDEHNEVYLALDFGLVRGPWVTGWQREWLAGAAVGWRGNFKGWSAQLAVERPLHYPKPAWNAEDTRLTASVTVEF